MQKREPEPNQIRAVHRAWALTCKLSNIEPAKILNTTTRQTRADLITQIFAHSMYTTPDGTTQKYGGIKPQQLEQIARESVRGDNPDFVANLRRCISLCTEDLGGGEELERMVWSAACFMRLKIRTYKDALDDKALEKFMRGKPSAAA